MRKLHLLMATLFGIFASSSGVLQTQAAIFNYFVDFIDKEVTDFNDFKPLFYADTYDLNANITMTWAGTYYYDSCPTNFSLPTAYTLQYRLNGIGADIFIGSINVPPLFCVTAPTVYSSSVTVPLIPEIVQAIMADDTEFVQFRSQIFLSGFAPASGRTLFLENHDVFFNLTYDFNTTYLFNYFLSDQQFVGRDTTGTSWTLNTQTASYLEYVYTTAGNDTFFVFNSLQADIGTTRKKYAIDVPDVYFRGISVGAQFRTQSALGVDSVNLVGSSTGLRYRYSYYFLNVANNQQAQVTVPQIAFTSQVCSGGFLDINVGCFFNNAMAWLVNDAPVVSSAFTLLNAGIVMAGQTFGIIGSFTQNNMFGVLILAGFGFIAVRWLIKND